MTVEIGTPKALRVHRVLLVDDHRLVREGLCALIGRERDLTVCATAASGSETLAALARLDPDVIVLDLSLGDADGTELIRTILARSDRARILVLSAYEEATYAERCLRAGARGYVNKRAAGEDLLRAIRVIVGGGLFLGTSMSPYRPRPPAPRPGRAGAEAGLELMSDRELELFALLGRGFGPSQIAAAMGLSVKTVEGYAARLKTKLGVTSVPDLRAFAVDWYRRLDG